MTRLRYSERHEAEIVALYAKGLGIPTIAKEAAMPQTSVWNILVRNRVERRSIRAACQDNSPPKGPLDVTELTRTVWLHEQGLTYAQIGELLGIGRLAVKARIKSARNRLGYYGRNAGHVNRTKAIPGHVRRVVANWAT